MFPAAENPLQGDDFAKTRPADIGELSPPASQDAPDQNSLQQTGDPMDISTNTAQPSHLATQNGNLPSQRGEPKKAPGAAWNNRKARDDYTRALDSVVDKRFSLSRPSFIWGSSVQSTDPGAEEYGDPFAEAAPPKKNGKGRA